MENEIEPLPEVDLGDGRTVISYEGTFYRVRYPNGEVQAKPAKSEATPENAVDDIITNPPAPAPEPPHRVLKDTIVQRVKTAGKLTELSALIATLSAADQFEFTQSTWFHSNNAQLRAAAEGLGLDPDVILARDPLAP